MNCLIYVRVSTEEQKKKGYSIDAQTDRCIKVTSKNSVFLKNKPVIARHNNTLRAVAISLK